MITFFKRMGAGAKVALCSAMVCLTGAVDEAYAQIDGNALLNSGTDTGKGLIVNIVRFLQIGLRIGALVMLVIVIYKLFKQEREAATGLIWWVVGLAVGFGLMTALANQLASV